MMDADSPAKYWDYFDKFYCISLDERMDRRADATAQFEKVGLADKVEFVIVKKHPHNIEQGIFESHLTCMEKGIRAGADTIVVFEDDILLERFSPAVLQDCIDFLSTNRHWNALYFGCLVSGSKKTQNRSVLKIKYRCLTHAYVFSRKFSESLVKKSWRDIPFDDFLCTLNDEFYAIYPSFAFQSTSRSDNIRFLPLDKFRRLCGGLRQVQKRNELYHRHRSLIILPVMFSAKELENKIEPLLETNEVHKRLQAIYLQLLEMSGIGQAEFISKDPLGLKDFILARLSHLAPSQNARIYRGKLISADGRHLLVIANPIASGTDTTFARTAAEPIDNLADELNRKYSEAGYDITLTPTGAYRAALDNELIIRRDVKNAILLATIGIAILLIFAFPRPLMGLLSLLPAIAGSMIAFFVFSLLHKSISIMVLGFGGAIISITVDHGIAYFLFLDRSYKTHGKEASTEVWAVGLLAALTTVGAFGVLTFSGFPVFEQLGLFTALGIAFSFLFVHSVFPKVFTAISPARPRRLPLENIVNALSLTGKKGAYAALGFAIVVLFFARPEFSVSLSSMNTVSKESIAAENLFADVWGNIFSKIYLMSEGQSVEELQKKGDSLLAMMDPDLVSGVLSTGFVPSMMFPGKDRRLENFTNWKRFWNQSRVSRFKHAMAEVSIETGFTVNAFKPFYELIDPDLSPPLDITIPKKFYSLMGITESLDIPALMLAIIVMGMGIDYSLFLSDPISVIRMHLIHLTV